MFRNARLSGSGVRSMAERRPAGAAPARKTAVVACMDARVDVLATLGLQLGDAHVIRNAGGVVTDDVIRSLTISQRLLGTEEIILLHHTDCGMMSFRDEELKTAIERETGRRPPYPMGAFTDLETDVRESMERIKSNPFLRHKKVRGFIVDVHTGSLREVLPERELAL
jgi:carbonic anhydrase